MGKVYTSRRRRVIQDLRAKRNRSIFASTASFVAVMSLFSSLPARRAAVAGMFYPRDAQTLAHEVEHALALAHPTSLAAGAPKALIVPHAGYVYSGPIAASAYATLRPVRDAVRRVVLLGPCHRVAIDGLALPGTRAFETPLGSVPIDEAAVAAIAQLPQVVVSEAAHRDEHSLEVQLPFLQRALADFTLVPLAVGDATRDEVADVLERLWGGPETLVVISSDLSHYQPYEVACALDRATVRAILALDPAIGHSQACGATPIAGLLELARRRRLEPKLIDLRNSGDTAGDRRRVVGYASLAFHEPDPDLARYEDEHGRTLIELARGSIREALTGAAAVAPRAPWLGEKRATFVTLRRGDALRGCIGTIEARRPLGEDVAANARAAALFDPRFAPLAPDELARTTIEVALLSRPQPLAFRSRDDLVAQLSPGEDGIVLESGKARATFLPQVWNELGDPCEFLAQLARKAGLPADFAYERCSVLRYRVRKWSERPDAARVEMFDEHRPAVPRCE
jgi:AmmeMemoRadiSam system protein B/AmmeMemoRadiSam system protein A